jgi:hypothetical protein
MLHQFTLENLARLDNGKAAAALDQHIRRAAADCMDRPADPKARVITLQIDLEPVLDTGDLSCSEVKAQIHVTSKVPSHKTRVYSLGLRRNGVLIFSEDSPDNINQTTLLDGPDGGDN